MREPNDLFWELAQTRTRTSSNGASNSNSLSKVPAPSMVNLIELSTNRTSRLTLNTDILEKLKAYVLSHPDVRHDHSRWILGMGWDQTKWPSATFPTAVRYLCPLYFTRISSLGRSLSLTMLSFSSHRTTSTVNLCFGTDPLHCLV